MSSRWPPLPYNVWSATCDTLHSHAQVLGNLAVTLAPQEPQLQHAALRLTARGWETQARTETEPIMTTTINDLEDFTALDPSFRVIETGLSGLADGGHVFDLLPEDVIFDYIITIPGYPRRVEGCNAVAELYRPYGTVIVLNRCHDLAVHHDITTNVVVLEPGT